jgi:predicted RNase H-like nuclease (RuvC/YqgF family)
VNTIAELKKAVWELEGKLGEARSEIARAEGNAHRVQQAASCLETLAKSLRNATAWVESTHEEHGRYGREVVLKIRGPEVSCILTISSRA